MTKGYRVNLKQIQVSLRSNMRNDLQVLYYPEGYPYLKTYIRVFKSSFFQDLRFMNQSLCHGMSQHNYYDSEGGIFINIM